MNNTLAIKDNETGIALISRANEYIADSVADNTKRGYSSDFHQFTIWCQSNSISPLPASPECVASYFSAMADDGKKPSTIDRARAAIKMAHETAGASDPTGHRSVKQTLKGIRRKLGVAQDKKAPILANDIKAMVSTLPNNTIGLRDRALILIGFAGAFRRSEVAGLTVTDIQSTSEGIKIFLSRSKTDQEGGGRYVGITRGSNPDTCPVRALQSWIDAAGITSGAIFRRVDRHGNIKEAITPQSVALVVKRAAAAAGLDPAVYSGHSLRAGLVTQAAINGATESNIMRQTGHKSSDTVKGYIRIANLFKDNVSGIVGL